MYCNVEDDNIYIYIHINADDDVDGDIGTLWLALIYTHYLNFLQLLPFEDRAAQEIFNDVTPDGKETGCKQFE